MPFGEIKFDNPGATDAADYLFRSKKKKAEVKLKKAQKALAKGNVKKAEKKLRKAGKVLGKTDNRDISADTARLIDLQQQATAIKTRDRDALQTYEQAKDLPPIQQPAPKPLAQPTTGQGEIIPFDPGSEPSPSAFPFLSGGGSGGMDIPEMSYQRQAPEGTDVQATEVMEEGETPAGNKTTLIIVVVVVLAILAFFMFKKKK